MEKIKINSFEYGGSYILETIDVDTFLSQISISAIIDPKVAIYDILESKKLEDLLTKMMSSLYNIIGLRNNKVYVEKVLLSIGAIRSKFFFYTLEEYEDVIFLINV